MQRQKKVVHDKAEELERLLIKEAEASGSAGSCWKKNGGHNGSWQKQRLVDSKCS
jgi:hypothetical protein